jgi:hypothetical protein
MNNQTNMNQYDIKQAADNARREQFMKAVRESDYVVCQDCGCGTFTAASFVKRVSGLSIGSGVDLLQPMPVYMCTACGRILTGEGQLNLVKVDRFNEFYGREYTEDEYSALSKGQSPNEDQTTEQSTPKEETNKIEGSSIITSENQGTPSQLIL